MKIIVTGINGYIGRSVGEWFKNRAEHEVSYLNLKDAQWTEQSFCGIDAIIHCAALVHKNENKIPLENYRRINALLSEKLANKAKTEGVKHFVFMSTKGVFGMKKNCFYESVADISTPVNPHTKYEISKLEAEKKILALEDEVFRVSIIRAPFVYGRGCSGNYQNLRNIVLKYHFIPKMDSKMSMIYIDNLCELIYQLVVQNCSGIFLPQDLPIRNTYEMCEMIAKINSCKVICTNVLNPIIRFLSIFCKPLRSAFGISYYSDESGVLKGIDYQVVGFEESIKRTEA